MEEVTGAEAASEYLRRRRVRSSLIEWGRYRGFEPAAHHRLICEEMENFLASDDEVLLLFAPPGSAKSTWVSVLTPSWYLSRNPTHCILAATHSIEFAQRWGRRIRNDIDAESRLLGISLQPDVKASDRWALTSGGEYYGVGAGVGIAGFRGDLAIGDDFFGSREDAYSPTVRDKRWEWYLYDYSARLKPHAKRILMNTRWHEEDVAGRILQQIEKGIVKGRVICIPAVAEDNDPIGRKPGEYLWDDPTGYDYAAFLRQRQRETSPMMWAALYQQRPAPEEGDYFKADWLKPIDIMPARETLRCYGGSDYAVTADGGDYTVHLVVGIDPVGRMYLLDLWREQAASDVWIETFCDMVLKWKPIGWSEEKGQISAGVGPWLEKRQSERKAYVYREPFPTRSDKAIRAQSIRGRMAMEGLYVNEKAPWYREFRSELLHFPSGAHDDQVDALGLVGQLLDIMLRGKAPKPEEPKKPDSGYREWRRTAVAGDWRVY
jgi:predicted phage terminase large subunit-like protein